MKEESLIQKRQKEVQSKIDENKNSTSPEFLKEDSFINLSPEKSLNNQKYSPSKSNFFGIKSSPTHTKENQLGSHSPLLNYYSGLSQDDKDYLYSCLKII